MADITITFEDLKTKTQKIRNHNETLNNTLLQIKSTINNLEAEWTSDASDTIRTKITGMQPKFDSYKEVIESYAKFLDNALAQYESTEATLNSNAGSQFM